MANSGQTDRRRHYRVAVPLPGRYMLPDQNEYPCKVTDISPGGLAISAPTSGKIGDKVIAYVDHVGRIEGTISRVFEGGFAVTNHVSDRKREQLAETLTWLSNREILSAADDVRRHERIEPPHTGSLLTLPDGEQVECTILDISISGAAVACSARPDVGSRVILGRTHGRVVRQHNEGIAIEFDAHVDLARRSAGLRLCAGGESVRG